MTKLAATSTTPATIPNNITRPDPIRPPVSIGEKPTLSLSDKFNAMTLNRELSSRGVLFREQFTKQTSDITFDRNGQPRGPEGQPLITVKRGKDTLYVDPNTNQYYVAQPSITDRLTGKTTAKGPLSLPEGAQFSNSHFSDADCKELTRWAGRSLGFPHFPTPLPGRDVFL